MRGRLNVAVLRILDGYANRVRGGHRSPQFAGLPDRVVEIGPGTGASLRYYQPGTRLVAVEPNPYMHAPLLWQRPAGAGSRCGCCGPGRSAVTPVPVLFPIGPRIAGAAVR